MADLPAKKTKLVGYFARLTDYFMLGSDRPVRRLVAYYVVLALATVVLVHFLPAAGKLFLGEKFDPHGTVSQVLQDGLTGTSASPGLDIMPRVEFAVLTTLVFFGTIALMLPVSWVYMSTREGAAHNQSVVQTLILLPLVVAGIVMIVRDSLALAFGLAGVVAAVRFRSTFSDARDLVYIFLAIVVGFAAGVHVLTVAALLSVIFNFVMLVIWRYDFGRNLLAPAAAEHWKEPLAHLAGSDAEGKVVPDRDLVLALTPQKVDLLVERFDRVQHLLGSHGKKPKYNAILTITSTSITEAQQHVEEVLEASTKRWKLDEVVTNATKPSELYYLVRMKLSVPKDALLTAIRAAAGASIAEATVEVGDAIAVESGEARALRKKEENPA